MITGVKGFNDILPGEVEKWQHIEATARRVFELYGLSEIRIPILEKTELFCRSIGDATDIVEKEMYSFVDKGENAVTMRPEGTASVMRSFIEHKLYAADPIAKLYYMGPMFRYERPQKGRYRQFHQIGCEVTGVTDPKVDAQVLTMLCHFFAELGLTEPRLEINSLGCRDCRPVYREALKDFLRSRLDDLCDDCRRRFETNPLRALDWPERPKRVRELRDAIRRGRRYAYQADPDRSKDRQAQLRCRRCDGGRFPRAAED